jgi:transposase-like protein
MKNRFKTEQEKEAIIAEYLLGGITYRNLEKKHGVDLSPHYALEKKY